MSFIDRINPFNKQPVIDFLASAQEKIGNVKEKAQETKVEFQTKIREKKAGFQEVVNETKEKVKNVFKKEDAESTKETKPINQKIVDLAESTVESVVGNVVEKIEKEKKSILGFLDRFSGKKNEQEVIALKEGVQNNRKEEIEQATQEKNFVEVGSDKEKKSILGFLNRFSGKKNEQEAMTLKEGVQNNRKEEIEQSIQEKNLVEIESDKVLIESSSEEQELTVRNEMGQEKSFIESDEASSRSKVDEGGQETREYITLDETSERVVEEPKEALNTTNADTVYQEDFFQEKRDRTETKPSAEKIAHKETRTWVPKTEERTKPKVSDKKKNKVEHKAHHGQGKKENKHKSGRKH